MFPPTAPADGGGKVSTVCGRPQLDPVLQDHGLLHDIIFMEKPSGQLGMFQDYSVDLVELDWTGQGRDGNFKEF